MFVGEGVSAMGRVLVCEGLGGLSCRAQMADGGRQREVIYLSRENTWSDECSGHVCLNAPGKMLMMQNTEGYR